MPCCTASAITPYVTGIAGIIAGGFSSYMVGVRLTQINHANARELALRNEFNKAAAEFRSAFVDDKYAIRQAMSTPDSDDQGFFLMSKIHKGVVAINLEKAKIRFEPYLTTAELKGFNAAWENYIEWPRHFQDNYDNKEKTFEMLRHLENLLKYADRK